MGVNLKSINYCLVNNQINSKASKLELVRFNQKNLVLSCKGETAL